MSPNYRILFKIGNHIKWVILVWKKVCMAQNILRNNGTINPNNMAVLKIIVLINVS